MVYKLTIDGGLLRQSDLSRAIQTLKHWESEGKLELFESDRAKETPATTLRPGWPGGERSSSSSGERPSFATSRARSIRPKDPNGLSFQQLAGVLFPTRAPSRLNMNEINDVVHLQQHHTLGRTFFVTPNARDFIDEGRRERLKSAFKISVLTPDEVVAHLMQTESWTDSAPAAPSRRAR